MLFIVQNELDVPAGRICSLAQKTGLAYRFLRAWEENLPDGLSGGDAAVVLGGTMCGLDTENHPFLKSVSAFLLAEAGRGAPLLGICLGGQLLAKALGGDILANRNGEKGATAARFTGPPDPLFAGIPERFPVTSFHNDSFTLPEGALLLAESVACPAQAFRWGERAYGLQFHPEADRAILEGWLKGEARAEEILASWLAARAEIERHAAQLIKNFLALARG